MNLDNDDLGTDHNGQCGDQYMPSLVSIVIPTYNRERFLAQALDSCIRQTYRPLEIVVVDDGSNDGTRELVSRVMSASASDVLRIHYCYQPNQGHAAAINNGFEISQGEFVQYLDDDDMIDSRKIEVQCNALARYPEAAFACSEMIEFVDAVVLPENPSTPELELVGLPGQFNRLRWNVFNGLYRREACVMTGPRNESLRIRVDLEYNLRFACLGLPAVHVEGTYAFNRIHENARVSTSLDRPGMIRAAVKAVRCAEKFCSTRGLESLAVREFLADQYYRIGRQAMLWKMRRAYVEALFGRGAKVVGPRKIFAKSKVFLLLTRLLGMSLVGTFTRALSYLRTL